MTPARQITLLPPHQAVLRLLRDMGPRRLSQLNEAALDDCFKARPRLVMIHTHHPDNPLIDITTQGLIALAAAETASMASA